jgi:hypothetical protein
VWERLDGVMRHAIKRHLSRARRPPPPCPPHPPPPSAASRQCSLWMSLGESVCLGERERG